jgi:hypothetical protein
MSFLPFASAMQISLALPLRDEHASRSTLYWASALRLASA